MTLWLYVPEGEAPFPAIIKVSSDGTGSQTQINQTIVDRGYIFTCYNHTALDPDTGGYDVDGPAQKAYPNYDWGSLGVWAWGAMRIADLLVGESWVAGAGDFSSHKVDTEKLIVTGHSRRGKTALLAAAYDERFAMVVPNGSGCGGCGSFLVQGPFSETIKMITSEKRFKSWFHEDFGKYGGNEEALPFDQHFIRALIAPRYIISTDGLQDYWANPTGTKAVHEASQPVFDFLNASDNNGIHYRDGGHGFLQEDFAVLLNFADKMLLGKNISDDFYMDPFDEDFPIEYSIPK